MRDPRGQARPGDPVLSRRHLLAGSAALAAGAALSPWANALAPLPRLAKTRRVIFVVLGGGVRTRETLDSGNTPNLDRIAAEGVTYPAVAAQNIGHYGAAVSILTGSYEVYGIRENARPNLPTIFESLRKGAGLGSSDVWLSTAGSDQETNYAYSTARGYGAQYGANLIGGDGIFNDEFKKMIAGDKGIPRADEESEATLAAMRGAVDTPLPARGDGASSVNDPETAARVEKYILDELRGTSAAITGVGASDAKAMHVARTLLGVFRPKVLGVTLRDADVAHGSYNDYVTVIKRNDDELGKIFDAIQGDPELADSTALFVMPEFGRDRDFNARRGLDHGDTSKELLEVSLVAWGPDFHKGKVHRGEIQTIDLAPTVLDLFDVRVKSNGSVLRSLYA